MKMQICFEATPAVREALDAAVAALNARTPGVAVSKASAIRVAICALADSLRRDAGEAA